jgi:hypothetical protein
VVDRLLLRRQAGARPRHHGRVVGCGRPLADEQGATVLEAYPVDKPEHSADDSMFFGAKSLYDHAGFDEVARRRPARPVVRKELRPR